MSKTVKGGKADHGWGRPGSEMESFSLDRNDPNYDSEAEYAEDLPLREAHYGGSGSGSALGSGSGSGSAGASGASGAAGAASSPPSAGGHSHHGTGDAGRAARWEEAHASFSHSVRSVSEFRRLTAAAIEEYLNSHDRDELVRCLNDERGFVYHSELPLLAVRLSLQRPDETEKLAGVLQFLSERGVVTAEQMEGGFVQVLSRLDDLALDSPAAPAALRKFVARAVAGEAIPQRFADDVLAALALREDPEALRRLKAQLSEAVSEYFANPDVSEVAAALRESRAPALYGHELVKRAVETAMGRTDRERELASYLVASGLVPERETERAFEVLLQRAEDLRNDVPRVVRLLACFVARAVADESLAPAFFRRVALLEDDLGAQSVREALVMLREKHANSRLGGIWGPGVGRTLASLKREVRVLVEELFSSGDVAEAVKCVRGLHSPHFGHEAVARAVIFASERSEREEKLTAEFLRALIAAGAVSQGQLDLGFARLEARAKDAVLDAPHFPAVLARVRAAVSEK